MLKTLFAAAGMLITFDAAAADEVPAKVDPRAVAECNARGGGYVKIKDCLPDVHVGYAVVDAFHNAFGEPGYPIKDRCIELNEAMTEKSATCMQEAVRAAVELKAQIPDGAIIDDPLFAVMADAAKLEIINAAETEARKAFPDQTYWGGGFYKPYQPEK